MQKNSDGKQEGYDINENEDRNFFHHSIDD